MSDGSRKISLLVIIPYVFWAATASHIMSSIWTVVPHRESSVFWAVCSALKKITLLVLKD